MATTTSSNYTSLYGAAGGTVVPTTPYGNANVVSLLAVGTDGANTVGNITSAGAITATGNIQTSAYFIGDGSLLTNLAGGSYGNANVAAFLPTYTGDMTAMTGAVTTTANISGNYFVGNGSLLTGISGTGTYGNANVAANLAAFANNPITTTGNISAGYFLGNGSQLTGLPATYGNANVVTLLSAFGSNTIVTTGNITGGNFVGSGAALSSITGGNVTGTVANATFATSAASATTATSATTAGTVTTAAQPNITSTGTLTSVVTTGNISATGNITGNYYIGNGSLLTGIAASTYGNANVAANLAAFANNPISTTGNITAGYFIGDGSQLTGISVAAGSKIENGGSNVNIPSSGSNINFTVPGFASGTVPAMQILTSNGAVFVNSELVVDGNVQVIANGNISAQGNVTGSNLITAGLITATGNVTGGNIRTAGQVSATGNITGNNISASGNITSSLTITAGYATIAQGINAGTITTLGNVDFGGQLDVAGAIFAPLSLISGGNLVATGSGVGFISATANVTGGNLRTAGIVSAGGNITSAGNIAASFFIGNGSQLTGITTTYGNANVAAFLPVYGGNLFVNNVTMDTANGALLSAGTISSVGSVIVLGDIFAGSGPGYAISTTGTLTGNVVTGNSYISTAGYVTATGNVTGGNINTAGQVSATGNITGSYFLGNGSQLTGIATVPGGSNTQLQFNNSGVFDGNANVTYNVATGNLSMYNNRLTVANVTTTVQAYDDSVVSATVVNPGRIIFGTGVNGNLTAAMDSSNWNRSALVLINQNITKGDNGRRIAAFDVEIPVELTANLANASSRLTAARSALFVGGGSSAYGMTSTNFSAWPRAITAAVQAGNNGNILVGNTVLNGAVVFSGSVDTSGTSTVGTAFGLRNEFNGNIGNVTGMINSVNLGNVGGNVSLMFNAAALHNTNARSSTNYMFLNNTDDVAQNRLGSLRSYTEFNAQSATTTGALTIDKTAGQVQQINLTGNISGITYSNFVSSASDGTNTDEQSDTVTMIFNQGATGNFGVTFPTGATYKYAGNVTALQSVAANSVSLVSVSAIRIGGTTTYLTTISPGFV